MWLDWDAAMSALGHETHVKRTYATLLASPDRPNLFIDVGANYGTHSIIFLVHGVETVTFEPNDQCHGYFREVARLNGVTPRLEALALGEHPGTAELCFPEGETWLGSIDQETVVRLQQEKPLIRKTIQVRPLDDFVELAKGKRVLLKIDAEGHEVVILRGATRLLAEARPSVLFETWASDKERRRALWEIFEKAGYDVFRLPLLAGVSPNRMSFSAFLSEPDGDFIGIPA